MALGARGGGGVLGAWGCSEGVPGVLGGSLRALEDLRGGCLGVSWGYWEGLVGTGMLWEDTEGLW